MPNLPSRQRFQIPDVLDPPNTVCLTMTVPDDPIHIANLLGALYGLAFGPNYENDDAHSAARLVQVWRRYYSTIAIDNCPLPPDMFPPGEVDIMTSLCENLRFQDGKLQALCCGDWVDIDGQPDGGFAPSNNVQNGTPQPQPGGGCQTYNGSLDADSKYYVPTVVNTGDVLTLSGAKGSTNDGASAVWRLYNGDQFFGGFDVGFPINSGSDPLPSARHMAVLYYIAGTYYDATTAFTVPGGVVNEQVVVVCNTDHPELAAGNLTFLVQVCNNQAGSWVSVFDFTTNSYASLMSLAYGTWTPGLGYAGLPGTGQTSTAILEIPSAATNITGATLTYSADGHGAPGDVVYVHDSVDYITTHNPPDVGSNIVLAGSNGHSGSTNIEVAIGLGSAGSACSFSRLILTGNGAKPAGWP